MVFLDGAFSVKFHCREYHYENYIYQLCIVYNSLFFVFSCFTLIQQNQSPPSLVDLFLKYGEFSADTKLGSILNVITSRGSRVKSGLECQPVERYKSSWQTNHHHL